MFSSVVLRCGMLGRVSKTTSGQCSALLYRSNCSVIPSPTSSPDKPSAERTAAIMANWDKANALFFGPERDYNNFPHPVQPEKAGKVRMAFIPEELFTSMYSKTGVLGPYVFGGGLVAYLLSKEIWVVDHGFVDVLSFWTAFYLLIRWVGPYLKEAAEDAMKEGADYEYNLPLARAKKLYGAQIEHCDREIFRVGAQQYINESKRENVQLQLEADYRNQLDSVFKQVKNKLDYVLEKETNERRMEQEHMVKWIVANVRSSITPDQEKNSISKCIQDLQGLAKTHSAVLA